MPQLTTKSQTGYSTWTDIFPLVSTESDSLMFVKRLTNLTIPTILYVRNILPISEFENKLFEGMTLKVLKSTGSTGTRKIEIWLAGAMDALEKKYLKSMILEIKDGRSGLILEIYTINVEYSENASLRVCMTNNEAKNMVVRNSRERISEIQQATVKFLQTCYSVTKSFAELPSEILLSMKLSYHENTPPNYQPFGYKEYSQPEPVFLNKTINTEIGVINTRHVFLELTNTTCLGGENIQSKTVEGENICKGARGSSTDTVSEKLKQTDRKLDLSQYSSQSSRSDISVCSQNSESGTGSQSDQIRCPCLSRIKTSSMYQCSGCGYWVHAECFGVRPGTSMKIFYCQICHRLNKDFLCHDKAMTSFSRHSDQQKLAVLRRLIGFCSRTQDEISFKKFEKVSGLACHQMFLQLVLKEMVGLGMLNKLPGNVYSVNCNNIQRKFGDYFYEESSLDSFTGNKKRTTPEQHDSGKRKLANAGDNAKKLKRTTLQDVKKLIAKKVNEEKHEFK